MPQGHRGALLKEPAIQTYPLLAYNPTPPLQLLGGYGTSAHRSRVTRVNARGGRGVVQAERSTQLVVTEVDECTPLEVRHDVPAPPPWHALKGWSWMHIVC